MALKITTQIGTDRGITNEAYVRIADYQVSKNGSANLRIELFQNQEASENAENVPAYSNQARNQEIGDTIWIPLKKEVEATRVVSKNLPVEVAAVLAEDGSVITPGSTRWEMQDVEETYTKTVPDLTPLEDATIFAFGYAKLKEKLSDLFGAENIVDC